MRYLLSLLAALSLCGALQAQQASWTTAPTLPGEGHWVLRETATLAWHEPSPGERRRSSMLSSRLSYGLDGERAVFLDLPARGLGRDRGPSLGDVAVGWKWRFHAQNTGPVDTTRMSLSLGATLPSGAERSTSGEVVPFADLAWMSISGRLGLGTSLTLEGGGDPYRRPLWADETGELNMRFAAAAVWRIDPVRYSSSLQAATYACVELISNAKADDLDGESELLLAPGLLYEAPSFAAELSYALPLHSDELESRPELDGALLFGLRFLW